MSTANVIRSIAGTPGFLQAAALANGAATVASTQDNPAGAFGYELDAIQPFTFPMAKPVAISFAAINQAFVMFNITKYSFNQLSSQCGKGYWSRIFCFYNAAGNLLFSIGWKQAGAISTWGTADYPDQITPEAKLYPVIAFYGASSNAVPTSFEYLTAIPQIPGKITNNNSVNPGYGKLCVYYNITTGVLEVTWRGAKHSIASVATKIGQTAKQVAKVTVGGHITVTGSPTINYGGGCIDSIIVADNVDYSLTCKTLHPVAFTENNQFVGDIANISTSLQDGTYVATSSEVSSVLEVELSDIVSLGGADTVDFLQLYTHLRYVQAGGTSLNFTCAIVDPAGSIHASAVVAVAANVAETLYNTNVAFASAYSQLTSAGYTLEQLRAMRVRISI